MDVGVTPSGSHALTIERPCDNPSAVTFVQDPAVTVAYRLARPEQEQLANQTEKIMNPDEFRRLALALPEAEAKNHQGTPGFRVRNKIFATLREDENRCGVKSPQEEVEELIKVSPETFESTPWKGWLKINLERIDDEELYELLLDGWRMVAPKRTIAAFDAETSR
jgi:hypothetical protein